MKDNYVTEVVFRKFKDGDVIALFPYQIETNEGQVMSYMHIGQHGGATLDLINITKLASTEEYSDLKSELESIGYNLKIMQKVNRRKYVDAVHDLYLKYK